MTDNPNINSEIDKFILEEIDSVPHLEAVLLLWKHRPRRWTVAEIASSLYVDQDMAEQILKDLANRRLITMEDRDVYFCEPDEELSRLLQCVGTAYSRELIRISRLIHSKAPAALREFARAFRFTKDRD